MNHVRYILLAILGCMALTIQAAEARAEDAYYMMVFSAQQEPNRARFAHSFATFVHVKRYIEPPDAVDYEVHTISWLPATLDVRTLSRRPERGVNLDLPTTINWLVCRGDRISMWGPYQITGEFYQRSACQAARLQSGNVFYKAVDENYRPAGIASNCIHSLSDIAPRCPLHVHRTWGDGASQIVVHHYAPWIIEPTRMHPWLIQALDLHRFPILVRSCAQ